jgi:hypothetical protein
MLASRDQLRIFPVRFELSNFGFEMRDSSDLKFLS